MTDNKAIMISVNPQECLNIMEKKQSALARIKFPKNYYGSIYIYCNKKKPYIIPKSERDQAFWEERKIDLSTALNGKVVCVVHCRGVGDVIWGGKYDYWNINSGCYTTKELGVTINLRNALHTEYDNMHKYFKGREKLGDKRGVVGKAIYIDPETVNVFDEPKELKSFVYYSKGNGSWCSFLNCIYLDHTKEECENCKEIHLQKAPKNYIYIETEVIQK